MESTIRDNINSSCYLYYYTTIETFIKIMETMSIKYGKGSNMNDMFESDRAIYYDSKDINIEKNFSKEISKYEQISFSIDSKNSKKLRGFEIPSMWGHYASKGYGVCLAIERNKLEDIHIVNRNMIKYSSKYNGDIIINCSDSTYLKRYIRNRIDDLFFKKSKSWAYEQEYRIISYFDTEGDHFLPIHYALSFNIVNLCKELKIVQRIAGTIPVYIWVFRR